MTGEKFREPGYHEMLRERDDLLREALPELHRTAADLTRRQGGWLLDPQRVEIAARLDILRALITKIEDTIDTTTTAPTYKNSILRNRQ